MLLYHFTHHDAVESIRAEGINRGEAPLSDTHVAQAVNLTSDPDPSGHGLDGGGRVVTAEESAGLLTRFGWIIPAGTIYANKRAVRITVKIPSSHTKLKRWATWAARNCEPGYPNRLIAAAGVNPKPESWWLYFGVVPPDRIVAVDVLEEAEPYSAEA